MNLRVQEIFSSIQGESTRAGQRCTFVRLAGCPVQCVYCDTPEAQDPASGRDMPVEEVVKEVRHLGEPLVEITGGEPLVQRPAVDILAVALLEAGLPVMLETSGCLSTRGLDGRIEMVMDVKTPGSGAALPLCERNLGILRPIDEIKFVIVDRADYEWSRRFVAEHDLDGLRAVHFSPAWGRLDPGVLAGWIRQDNPPVRFTLQLHKLLGVA